MARRGSKTEHRKSGKKGTKTSARVNSAKRCYCKVCRDPLLNRGGCGGTGLCGPCCLGDASTVGEY